MLAGLALVAVFAPSARAADEITVGTVAVNGKAEATATSDVTLKAGVKYRLVVSGTSTVSLDTNSASYDALYCYQSTSSQCSSPFPEGGAFGIGFKVPGSDDPSTQDFVHFTNQPGWPVYSGGHSYSGSFTPAVNGSLFLRGWPGRYASDGVTRSGSFTVTIYGPSDAGCVDTSGPNEDHGTCDYRAPWEAALSVKPTDGPSDITRIEIKAKGDLYFDRKVRADKWAQAEPSGRFAFIERFRADPNYNGGNPSAVTIRYRLINARVKYTRAARILDFDAEIASVSGRGPSQCSRGYSARITLTQRGGKARDEVDIKVYGSPYCFGFSGKGEALRVTIDRPVKI
jgi:hypothetical protein